MMKYSLIFSCSTTELVHKVVCLVGAFRAVLISNKTRGLFEQGKRERGGEPIPSATAGWEMVI